MNKRFVSFLSGILALLTVVGGLDLTGIITLLPDHIAQAFVIGLPALAGFKHLIIDLGDFADDGKINGSFKLLPFLLWLAIGALSFGTLSCAAFTSAATGQPIPSTAVKRDVPEAKPFNVATLDVQRAEASPPATIWGLYNAGGLADTARALAIEATK